MFLRRRRSGLRGRLGRPLFLTLGGILLFLGVCLLSACQTINRSNARLDLPEGYIIFTFDDGPNPLGNTTARLLDVLEKHHIRAMFALLGENVLRSPELVRRIRNEGHYVINHGYDDKWAVTMNNRQFIRNLIRGENALASALSEVPNPRLYRPQGGFYKIRQKKLWKSRGYVMVPASARAYDAVCGEGEKDMVVRRIVEIVEREKGGLIVLHDARDSQRKMRFHLAKEPGGAFNRSWIPGAVEEIILILREKGYTLEGFVIPRVLNLESF